jgi:hypothetical protein
MFFFQVQISYVLGFISICDLFTDSTFIIIIPHVSACYYYYLFILTANGFLPSGSGTTIRHNTQITHHTQTKHSTQNYTNNKGYTAHNERHYTQWRTHYTQCIQWVRLMNCSVLLKITEWRSLVYMAVSCYGNAFTFLHLKLAVSKWMFCAVVFVAYLSKM